MNELIGESESFFDSASSKNPIFIADFGMDKSPSVLGNEQQKHEQQATSSTLSLSHSANTFINGSTALTPPNRESDNKSFLDNSPLSFTSEMTNDSKMESYSKQGSSINERYSLTPIS